jgi:hypothetical protein
MAFFHVFLRGEHFLIERDGKQAWLGFYKNVYAAAPSSDEAIDIAIARACADPSFRASVKNPADQPPAMNVEEITEIDRDDSLLDSEFVYFPDQDA